MAELAEVARSQDRPGGESDNLFRPILEMSSNPPDMITSELFKRNISEAEHERMLFTKKNNPNLDSHYR